MKVHDLSGGDAVLARVDGVARRALHAYGLPPTATATLINVSENATFRVDDPATGDRAVLRVHRLDYHSERAIHSELDWLTALRTDAGVRTPRVRTTLRGERVVTIADPDGPEPRRCVMFEFLPGSEPAEDGLVDHFEVLGALTARMHRHARSWNAPEGFTRFRWDYGAALGAESRWGRWEGGAGVDGEARAVLARLDGELRRRLRRYGAGPDRYGLIHADLRLANLLADGSAEPAVIDFDDCGYGWRLYDLAAALSFIEHHPRVPDMIDSWLRGYRAVLDLPAADEEEIWTFILFRRLLLVAWIGTHPGAAIAGALGAGYTLGTCELAERYLRGRLPVPR
ncbi:Ser/Thr protein kinase RdoA involved in Cpx stress response, MazF antagonist [Sinosporangium album]|uniref:Ser/Thr protein kinase RdoA involved in Cpx stress response, MazF antagonist n=1 Tax=Sinosporangium album TaxID=504805 RepID=A0A1G8GFA5_9ACTN|nr:Ser/Thr protein kinase RdoA involved in Cpx stress response, MazF antagonist [Sinosporangium album]